MPYTCTYCKQQEQTVNDFMRHVCSVSDLKEQINKLKEDLTISNACLSDDKGMYSLRVAEKKLIQKSLEWALTKISERFGIDSQGVPRHNCSLYFSPDCEFHEKFWTAKKLLKI